MVITKMGVFRQNSIKLVAFLLLMILMFRLMSLSTHHNFIADEEQAADSQEIHLTKEDMHLLRLFKRANVRSVMDVMEKLSNILNKSDPVVSIRLEMKTDENGNKIKVPPQSAEDNEKLPISPVKTDEDKTSVNKLNSISLRRNLESKDYDVADTSWGEKSKNKTKLKRDTFVISLTPGEKQLLYDAAEYFATVCAKLNITYMMYGGTLLGSWRHHDIIPWDDDIDMQVNVRDRDELYSALSLDSHQFQVVSAGPRLKLFSRAGKKTSRYPWLWPYIDVHFYKENDTHIRDISKEFSNYVYEKSILFPLHDRPLGPLNLSAPKDSYAALRKTYKGHSCETYSYSHKLEKVRKVRKTLVSCLIFRDQVPFVHRKSCLGGVEETLMLADTVIQRVLVSEPEYALTDPYSLELVH